ncbi:MAG: hypothetical protein COB88_10465 [Flavobacteriales bacterium]|nr:MAG: hypothetical protein COB88_10465 [Flavobacteriales bacterium]
MKAIAISVIVVLGQDTSTINSPGKLCVGISYATGISSKRHLKSNETFKYSPISGGGARFKYSISNKFSLRSGIGLVDRGFKVKNGGICLGFDCSDYYYKNLYLDVPLLLQFTFLDKKRTGFFFAGGLIASVFVHDPDGLTYQYVDNKSSIVIIYEDNYKPITANIEAALGMDWHVSDKYEVTMEQFFQYGLMEFQKNRATFKDYDGTVYQVSEPRFIYIPFFVGIRVTLMYKL